MRTPLLGVLVAAILSACGTVLPSPSPSTLPTPPASPSTPATPASPSPSPSAAGPSVMPSPAPSTPYTLDCGPLGAPDDCAAAVEAGLRLLSLAPEDISAVRVEPPVLHTCSAHFAICLQPTVIVKAFTGAGAVAAGEMPLIRTGTGWIGLFQVR